MVSLNVDPTGSRRFEADNKAHVMKHGQSPAVTWKDKETLVLDSSDCGKDEVTRRSEIGHIRIEFGLR
jgi:hypothetical protein